MIGLCTRYDILLRTYLIFTGGSKSAKFCLILAFKALQFENEATYLKCKTHIGISNDRPVSYQILSRLVIQLWEVGIIKLTLKSRPGKCVESASSHSGLATRLYQSLRSKLKPWLRQTFCSFYGGYKKCKIALSFWPQLPLMHSDLEAEQHIRRLKCAYELW